MGKIIYLEGGEAAGKTTCGRELLNRLRVEKYPMFNRILYEPGSSSVGEVCRTALKCRNDTGATHISEELIQSVSVSPIIHCEMTAYKAFALNRSDIFRLLVGPSLQEGLNILCDRGFFSSLVYQGQGEPTSFMFQHIIEDTADMLAYHQISPSQIACVHFDVGAEIAAQRKNLMGDTPDAIEERMGAINELNNRYRRLREYFNSLQPHEPLYGVQMISIDGEQSEAKVLASAFQSICKLLDEK